MEAKLTAGPETVVGGCSKGSVVGRLVETNNLSSLVRQAEKQGSSVQDTELVNLSANLNMTRGKPADDAAATQAATVYILRTRRMLLRLCDWMWWTA